MGLFFLENSLVGWVTGISLLFLNVILSFNPPVNLILHPYNVSFIAANHNVLLVVTVVLDLGLHDGANCVFYGISG